MRTNLGRAARMHQSVESFARPSFPSRLAVNHDMGSKRTILQPLDDSQNARHVGCASDIRPNAEIQVLSCSSPPPKIPDVSFGMALMG